MYKETAVRKATIVRVFDNIVNIQVLCADEMGLFSLYFEHKPFYAFHKMIKNAGLKLYGLNIEFNNDVVCVAESANKCRIKPISRRTMIA